MLPAQRNGLRALPWVEAEAALGLALGQAAQQQPGLLVTVARQVQQAL